jgi:hypothetical protein
VTRYCINFELVELEKRKCDETTSMSCHLKFKVWISTSISFPDLAVTLIQLSKAL